jgi:CDP-glycerol glycerophosphotransferase
MKFFGKHRTSIKPQCSLNNIKYKNGKVLIVLKLVYAEAYSAIFFNLHKRDTQVSLKFPVSVEAISEHSCFLKLEVSMTDYAESLLHGFWDANLLLENMGQESKVRIANHLTNSNEPQPFYIKGHDKNFVPYATMNGNLSFKSEDAAPILKTQTIVLEENGTLRLSGYLLVPWWNVQNNEDVQKRLILRFGEDERDIVMTDVLRTDMTTYYQQEDQAYEWTGFAVEFNFPNSTYGLPDGAPADLLLEYEYNHSSITLPITFPSSGVLNRTSTFQSFDGIQQLAIKKRMKTNGIVLLLTKEELHAEVDEIYSEGGQISIHGRIITINKGERISFEDTFIIVKNRTSKAEYSFKVKIDSFHFNYTFDLSSLVKNEDIFSEGLWDLFLQVDGVMYRLVTRLDGIKNKQNRISFPPYKLANKDGEIIVIKPYYTLKDELSIMTKPYIAAKSISKAEIHNSIFLIDGKLHVQIPNKDLPEISQGHIMIKGQFGKNYDIPVSWKLQKTENTKNEFHFTLSADLKAAGLLEERDVLLRDINFDLIYCEIDFEDGKAIFTMNVTPEKVVLTLEDRLKQNDKYKALLSKWGLLVYKLCFKFLPVNRKAVVFQSFYGKSYSDNPKALYEEMLAQHRDMKAVWVINNLKADIPGNPILVRPRSFKYYYYMAISTYFVNNGNFPDFFQKRKGMTFLQTWHGTPLKKLGFDVDPKALAYEENTSPALLKRIEKWDYLIGPNLYTAEILKRAYKYKKKMLNVGYPRNDIFYKENIRTKIIDIKKKLNIPLNKKVILYAPTWRDYEYQNGNQHRAYEFKFDLKTFKEKFGEEYILLLRLHYFDASRIRLHRSDDFIYNVSSYDDIGELYLISDLMITDYSSVMFDYANLNRPMIFFTYDLKRYGSQVRGFYFNFVEEAPGPIVTDQEQLFDAIEHIDRLQSEYQIKYDQFKDRFCHWEDGQASKRTIEAVFKNL